MIYLLTYFILWIIAGFFNAVMDAIDLHPITNTFPKRKFYQMSLKGWRFDAWHISKFIMELCFAGAGICLWMSTEILLLGIIFVVIASSFGYAIIHNLFFHHVFFRKLL